MTWRGFCASVVVVFVASGCGGLRWPGAQPAPGKPAEAQGRTASLSEEESPRAGGGPADAAGNATRSAASAPAQAGPGEQPAERSPRTGTGGRAIRANVLRVNAEVITVQDVLEPIWELLEGEVQELSPGEYQMRLERRIREEVREQVYEALVHARARRELKDEQMEPLDKAVDQLLKDRVNRTYRGSQSAFEQYLQRFGKTIEDVREREKRGLIVQQYLRAQIVPRMHITRRDLLKYWQQHREQFDQKAQTELYLIDVPGWAFLPGPDQRLRASVGAELWQRTSAAARQEAMTKARRQIERAQEELGSGVAFEAVAKSYSSGVNAASGGSWGFVAPGELQGRWAVLNGVLEGLEAGQSSAIIEAEDGFFLMQAGQRHEGKTVSFEQAQPEIERVLVDAETDRLMVELMARLRGEATMSGPEEQAAFLEAVVHAAPQPRLMEPAAAGGEREP